MLPLNNITAAILSWMRTLMKEEAGAASVAARASCTAYSSGSGKGSGDWTGSGEGGGAGAAADGNGPQQAAWALPLSCREAAVSSEKLQ